VIARETTGRLIRALVGEFANKFGAEFTDDIELVLIGRCCLQIS
jgi:hypothetical protein